MRRFASLFAFGMAALLATALIMPAAPAEQGKAKEDRLTGRIVMVAKNNSTITVQQPDNSRRVIVYSGDTKFTYRNQPGAFSDLQDGLRVICLGKVDDKGQFVATRVDLREK